MCSKLAKVNLIRILNLEVAELPYNARRCNNENFKIPMNCDTAECLADLKPFDVEGRYYLSLQNILVEVYDVDPLSKF